MFIKNQTPFNNLNQRDLFHANNLITASLKPEKKQGFFSRLFSKKSTGTGIETKMLLADSYHNHNLAVPSVFVNSLQNLHIKIHSDQNNILYHNSPFLPHINVTSNERYYEPRFNNYSTGVAQSNDGHGNSQIDINAIWSSLDSKTSQQRESVKMHNFKSTESYCFSDQPCPEATRVFKRLGDPNYEFHANNLTITPPNNNVKVEIIASQQPGDSEGSRNKFSEMLEQKSINTIFDLRRTDEALANHYKLPSKVTKRKFTEWPDHGVISVAQLKGLRAQLNNDIQAGKKILVHCRAGIGRTGTLLTYTSLYNQFQKVRPLNQQDAILKVKDEVLRLRAQRGPGFVQNSDQLKLIIDTLIDDFNLRS